MKFFIPGAKDSKQAEEVYEATKTFASEQTGFKPSDRRIFHLSYRHEGRDYQAEVGQIHNRLSETVIAVLETSTIGGQMVYLVCTPNRSVLRGEPMLVGSNEVKSIVDFE